MKKHFASQKGNQETGQPTEVSQREAEESAGVSAGYGRGQAREPRNDGRERRDPAESSTSRQHNSDSTARITELTADLQRTRADFENFRKQVDLQREQAKSAAAGATVLKFIPLIDDMDRAITAYPDQLSALAKSFAKTLKNLDLEKIDTTPGVDFNPDLHEAISMEDGEGDREVIAETLRPGYLYQGQVLRPAMVRVTHEAS